MKLIKVQIQGKSWTIPLASLILFWIMREYFCLVLKIKIEISEAKHQTFRNCPIETLQVENTEKDFKKSLRHFQDL